MDGYGTAPPAAVVPDHALDLTGSLLVLAVAPRWALSIVLGKRTAHLPSGQTVALGIVLASIGQARRRVRF